MWDYQRVYSGTLELLFDPFGAKAAMAVVKAAESAKCTYVFVWNDVMMVNPLLKFVANWNSISGWRNVRNHQSVMTLDSQGFGWVEQLSHIPVDKPSDSKYHVVGKL